MDGEAATGQMYFFIHVVSGPLHVVSPCFYIGKSGLPHSMVALPSSWTTSREAQYSGASFPATLPFFSL